MEAFDPHAWKPPRPAELFRRLKIELKQKPAGDGVEEEGGFAAHANRDLTVPDVAVSHQRV